MQEHQNGQEKQWSKDPERRRWFGLDRNCALPLSPVFPRVLTAAHTPSSLAARIAVARKHTDNTSSAV